MIRKEVLANGLTVVSEEIPYANSVSMGIWVKTGSRHETREYAGISHFLEHMNFKGTEKRDARALAEVLECRGGQLNAFTTKEYTNFYCQTVKEDYDLAMDVLSDLYLASVFDPAETEKEKKVVIEEIYLYDDSPEDLVIDMLNETCWPRHPLGRPILGYEEQVRGFTADTLKTYRRERYTPENSVLAVAGSFDYEKILAAAKRYFGDFQGKTQETAFPAPQYHPGEVKKKKDVAQEHICIGFPSCSIFDDNYFTSILISDYLGGGASSLLFQKIREERALSYSVYSFTNSYEDTGMLAVYAGTSMGQGQQVKDLCFAEIEALRQDGIPERALQNLKDQISGGMRIGLDSIGSRLSRLGRNELFFRRYIPIEEVVERINAVTAADFQAVAEKIFDPAQAAVAFLGGKSE
ncbi:MAG TPA: pitrilysin family protein [Clostridiales bacterium]|nr:pitrilysin family protein [Clostridiales bacterium]